MDPIVIVDEYLQLCEQRRLEEAARCLGNGAKLIFPGEKRYANLEEMADDARSRYRWIKKRRTHYAVGSDNNHTIVVSRGTLYGENLLGVPFQNIRYVDFFLLESGKIVEQDVWNDLCESGVLERNSANDQGP